MFILFLWLQQITVFIANHRKVKQKHILRRELKGPLLCKCKSAHFWTNYCIFQAAKAELFGIYR